MICRNLKVNGRRTSVRMEQSYWDALEDVARRRGVSVVALVAEVDLARGGGSLTDGLRLTALSYFRGLVNQLDQYGLLRAVVEESKPRLKFRGSKRRSSDQAPRVMPEHATLQ